MKISAEQIAELFERRYSHGERIIDLANEYRISHAYATRLLQGEQQTAITEPLMDEYAKCIPLQGKLNELHRAVAALQKVIEGYKDGTYKMGTPKNGGRCDSCGAGVAAREDKASVRSVFLAMSGNVR